MFLLAHGEVTRVRPELASLLIARIFFSCFLSPAFAACEAYIPNFNAGKEDSILNVYRYIDI